MEPHQILRPKRCRGTPAESFMGRAGLAVAALTVVSYFIMDAIKGKRMEEKISAGYYILPDRMRYNNYLMGQMKFTDAISAKKIRELQDESVYNQHIIESSVPQIDP